MDTFGGNTGSPVPFYNPNASMQTPGAMGGGLPPGATSVTQPTRGTPSVYPGMQDPGKFTPVAGGGMMDEKGVISYAPPAPTLNAQFASPPTGTQKPPAVVTAQTATDHANTMNTAAQTASTDTQNAAIHAANLKALSIAAHNSTLTADNVKTNTTNDTSTQGGYDAQVNSILGELGTGLSTTAQTPPEQQAIIDQDNAQIAADQAVQAQTQDSLDSMAAGTFPLTPAEQNQVRGLQAQYAGAIKDAQAYATALGAGAATAAARSGIQMYSPQEALGRIQNAVNAGAKKMDTVNAKILSSMSKLTVALQNRDYKAATALYKAVGDDIKNRTKEVDDINKAVDTATKQMHTDALNFAKEQIAGDKFVYQQGKDAAAQQYKESQATIANLYKQGVLDERTRHDLQTEAVTTHREMRLATAGSPTGGGGKPIKSGSHTFDVGEVSQIGAYLTGGGTIDGQEYAARGADGYVDPGVYHALADSWQTKGGTLKNFLAQWPAKYYINPAAQVPSWMSTAPKASTGGQSVPVPPAK